MVFFLFGRASICFLLFQAKRLEVLDCLSPEAGFILIWIVYDNITFEMQIV